MYSTSVLLDNSFIVLISLSEHFLHKLMQRLYVFLQIKTNGSVSLWQVFIYSPVWDLLLPIDTKYKGTNSL